jgi:TolB-like protein/class 3 adenylate cyclase/Flp pilus assembly protein TadD
MADPKVHRELKAIFSADVKGYSRLMGDDDEHTIRTIINYRGIITRLIQKYQGRVVDAPGDNILAEFGSPINAVNGAMKIQKALKSENDKLPEQRRMDFRIGINLGDIIHVEDRIYGDSVNIAARIESLADPGGISISRGVFEQVDGKVSADFVDLGPHSVKNIKKPVTIYKLLISEAGRTSEDAKAKVPRWRLIPVAIIAVALVAAGAILFYHRSKPDFQPASVERMAYSLPDMPSIAVLPFDNFSDDEKLGFFASGLTEDLTTALSKVPELFVISRNSTATYKGKPTNVKQVAEEQGVQYVLGGSVQRAGDQLRITTQLIDALNGRHLRAERFNRSEKDIFALQDEIVKRVVVELQVKLTEGDRARIASRGTDNLEAWLLRYEAAAEFYKFTREGMVRARELYEAAHRADPDWSRPVAALASVDWYEAKRGWSASKADPIRSGLALAQRSIEMDPKDPLGYHALGNLYALNGQGERAIELRRKAVELAPNDFNAVAGLATRLKDFGGEQEAVQLFEHAMRLSPKHPWWVLHGYGVALHLVGRKKEAVVSLRKAISHKPKTDLPYAFLAAVYADMGRMEEAKQAAREVTRLNPTFSANRFMKSHTLHDAARDARFVELLRRAGLPQ